MVIDDYGAHPGPANVVEENLSSGSFSHCEPLGRRAGESIPGASGRKLLGPEAVLCAVRAPAAAPRWPAKVTSRPLVYYGAQQVAEKEEEGNGNLLFALHRRIFEVCLAPCTIMEHIVELFGGHVNFSEAGGARVAAQEVPEGSVDAVARGFFWVSRYRGGGRGRWQQSRPGALMAAASFKGQRYTFSFLPSMAAFQANELYSNGSIGRLVFKAPRVSLVRSGWFRGDADGPAEELYRAAPPLL
eukprot:TRINITY_DN51707_c0_g1_i1.p1 TRINITY_DN51707_c0_g1~~TRINITY_DN51707_c0_g1_i1.p1  ORF type:complete len:244 (-),score=41.35 TRINITY_DN51707_c0_g1_i1:61-792(-)